MNHKIYGNNSNYLNFKINYFRLNLKFEYLSIRILIDLYIMYFILINYLYIVNKYIHESY